MLQKMHNSDKFLTKIAFLASEKKCERLQKNYLNVKNDTIASSSIERMEKRNTMHLVRNSKSFLTFIAWS